MLSPDCLGGIANLDPNLFFKFALVSKRTNSVARQQTTKIKEHFSINGYLPNGWKHGVHEEYYSNGQIKTRINWKDGKKHGLFEEFRTTGQIWGNLTVV